MDVDHNPNMPHLLTTCGQDGLVKFWDVRKGMGLGGGSGGSSGLIGSTSFPSSPVSVPSPLKDYTTNTILPTTIVVMVVVVDVG